jgi:CDP-diglyceride synthetase
MLSQRVKAALIFVPLVLILIYLGGWAFNLFTLALLLGAAFEYTRLFNKIGYHPSLGIILVGVAVSVDAALAVPGRRSRAAVDDNPVADHPGCTG